MPDLRTRTDSYEAIVPEFHHLDPQGIKDHAHRLNPAGVQIDDWPDLALALLQHQEKIGSTRPYEALTIVRCDGGFFVAWIPDAAAYYHYRVLHDRGHIVYYYAVERGEILSNVVRYKVIKEWRPSIS